MQINSEELLRHIMAETKHAVWADLSNQLIGQGLKSIASKDISVGVSLDEVPHYYLHLHLNQEILKYSGNSYRKLIESAIHGIVSSPNLSQCLTD